jgi:hypothetical protein
MMQFWLNRQKHIIGCREESRDGVRPLTLRQMGVAAIVGRQITEWDAHRGTYGTGGPGFFGLHLRGSKADDDFWLVLAVWGASNWLLLDNINITIFPNREIDRNSPKVWLEISGLGDPTIDNLSDKLLGATITAAEVTDSSSRLELTQGSARHLLELSNDPRPSAVTLSGKPRRWNPNESHLDAWVVSRSGYLWLRK